MVDEQPEDPFGVQLSWPAEQERDLMAPSPAPTGARALVETSPDPAGAEAASWSSSAADSAAWTASSPEAVVEGDAIASPEGMRVLAQVVARVDALAAATTTFRNLISDRVSEYTERVVQVAAASAADFEEQRRVGDREIAALRGRLDQANADIARLVAAVDALTDDVNRVGTTLGDQLGRVAAEVQTLRKRTALRPRAGSADHDRDDAKPIPRRPVRRRAD